MFYLLYSRLTHPVCFSWPMGWQRGRSKMLSDIPRDALLRPLTRNEVLGMLVRLTIFGAATYYSIKWVVDAFDPTQKQKAQAKKRVKISLLADV